MVELKKRSVNPVEREFNQLKHCSIENNRDTCLNKDKHINKCWKCGFSYPNNDDEACRQLVKVIIILQLF